ncbi:MULTISPECIES: hypothetical protein [Streptomyces]|uniref:Uncharacterized protein n=1 Tax=Streptomyces desertarenae TaxID=2666184 RepID=A0ABW4PFM0_9ACTN
MFGRGRTTVDAKKTVLYALLAFILYTIISSPDRAAELVGVGFEGISNAAKGIGAFMTELVN